MEGQEGWREVREGGEGAREAESEAGRQAGRDDKREAGIERKREGVRE